MTVACADGAVRLDLDAQAAFVGETVAVLTPEQRAALTQAGDRAAKQDGFWRKRLFLMNPAVLPGVSAPQAPRERVALGAASGDQALAVVVAVLARLAGLTETGFGLRPDGVDLYPGISSDWVPLAVNAAPKSTFPP
ncbi:hypothetical protein PE067_11800 [Paracoccus sp. DMF-8]|uniref:hypothetical protein n=1 Tax=Paracoccus sp. DMF-8 TaxID=3019445 RepID=UPI0023E7F9B2|nr:hypothetical protein [Paracoccus sp. DMF-8]MDF3606750.1 hypothetical protein [Paracoccus sp. DMF-8]